MPTSEPVVRGMADAQVGEAWAQSPSENRKAERRGQMLCGPKKGDWVLGQKANRVPASQALEGWGGVWPSAWHRASPQLTRALWTVIAPVFTDGASVLGRM